MKKIFILFLLACSLTASAQKNEKPFAVPEIKTWKAGTGSFDIRKDIQVSYGIGKLKMVANYLTKTLGLTEPKEAKAGKEGISLDVVKNKKFGAEGYSITTTNKSIKIEAATEQGVLWAVQTLIQIHQLQGVIPCGTINDMPDYKMRGFMIDCGRKYIPLDYLRNLVKVMSYYKMNTLQVHLNDNGFKQYFDNDWDKTYAGFRLESDFFPGLTSKDGFYSKKAFRNFIKESARWGVEIIPEIDAPAHVLAFSHYRKSLGSKEYGMDHLELRNPEVIPFLDSLYMEYLGGDNPVFCCPRVHIGTDEYSNRDKEIVEMFRSLTDHLMGTIQSYGKQPVVWGSLTHAKGTTPVRSENVMMSIWSKDYSNPDEMKSLGYQMISIPDGYVYIVPEAGYYYNYLNDQMLYEHYTPARMGGNFLLEEHDPKIEGGMFAVWNDVVGNGVSVGDIHHRVLPAMQVMAHKTWHAVNDTLGYANWDANRRKLGDAPNVNELGRTTASFSTLKPNTKISNRGLCQLGYDYQVDFDIKWRHESSGTVLTKSDRATFYLSDPIGGWMGFSRDGYLFTFNYKGTPGKTEHITIIGTNKSTTLIVDGKKVEELGCEKVYYMGGKSFNRIRTLVFPLQSVGRFKSDITNFKAKKL